jgi:hypothetical protein
MKSKTVSRKDANAQRNAKKLSSICLASLFAFASLREIVFPGRVEEQAN